MFVYLLGQMLKKNAIAKVTRLIYEMVWVIFVYLSTHCRVCCSWSGARERHAGFNKSTGWFSLSVGWCEFSVGLSAYGQHKLPIYVTPCAQYTIYIHHACDTHSYIHHMYTYIEYVCMCIRICLAGPEHQLTKTNHLCAVIKRGYWHLMISKLRQWNLTSVCWRSWTPHPGMRPLLYPHPPTSCPMFVLTLNSIYSHDTWSILSCARDNPVEYLPQVPPMWVWVIAFQILLSKLPNLFFSCQFKELRRNYLQEKRRKETKVARVRCVPNTLISWLIYRSDSQLIEQTILQTIISHCHTYHNLTLNLHLNQRSTLSYVVQARAES